MPERPALLRYITKKRRYQMPYTLHYISLHYNVHHADAHCLHKILFENKLEQASSWNTRVLKHEHVIGSIPEITVKIHYTLTRYPTADQ